MKSKYTQYFGVLFPALSSYNIHALEDGFTNIQSLGKKQGFPFF